MIASVEITEQSTGTPLRTARPGVFPRRFAALDQLRAVAIACMMLAHLGPGVLSRIPLSPAVQEIVFACSRFATPAFVACFGISLGLVYRHRLQSSGPARERARQSMQRRAAIVGICALLIAAPKMWDAAGHEHGMLGGVVLGLYSILVFYGVAMALLSAAPAWMWCRSDRALLVTGVSLWGAGSLLAFALWTPDPRVGPGELARYMLVSGPFPIVQLLGFAVLFIPLGSAIRLRWMRRDHRRLIGPLLGFGAALALASAALGGAMGELSIEAIARGLVKAPPRMWYFAMFAGVSLVVLGLFIWAERFRPGRRVLAPLSLAGQCALPIYTAECLSLPLARLLHGPAGVPEPFGGVIALLCLFTFIVALLWVRSGSSRGADQRRTLHAPGNERGFTLALASRSGMGAGS